MSLSSIYRELPPFKGKKRLGSLLFKKAITGRKDILIHGKNDCQYLLPNLKETLGLDIFLEGIYEPETHEFLLNAIPQNAVVLDIGANIGSISIPVLKKRTDLTCVCVEASPFVFDYLQKNVQLNGLESRMICINKALTNKDGEVLPFYSDPSTFGKGSLSAVFTDKPVMVETITVATLLKQLNIPNIQFIKADIEGYEYFAFQGCEQILRQPDAPSILFEFVDWAEQNANLQPGKAQQLVVDAGYDMYVLDGRSDLKEIETVLTKNSAMLYATKNSRHAKNAK